MSRALGRRAELVEALAGTDGDTSARAAVCAHMEQHASLIRE
ncbi:hypothetical protein [Rhodococcus qingshengii]|nr:hypothetical protein [Rhodococcus qingshengii]